MDKINVSDEQVRSVLRTVALERPEYVYDEQDEDGSCQYVNNGAPSCLVGHVLHRLGVPLDVLREREGDKALHVARDLLSVSDVTAGCLNRAQIRQDDGETWGDAIAGLV
ncbi:hypothetical protein [Streptomyces lycii]|uniref:Uncharacterized protein n=1 Tax=Streptomyces lycii TaxID=2654337 RepID=A0ABQ7FLH9_9ACTN|nr:hypothetical protein [Streptomyces lycii]KAF4408621.1 hypothetical protein GCU69_13055 [Streptomyces lycii]